MRKLSQQITLVNHFLWYLRKSGSHYLEHHPETAYWSQVVVDEKLINSPMPHCTRVMRRRTLPVSVLRDMRSQMHQPLSHRSSGDRQVAWWTLLRDPRQGVRPSWYYALINWLTVTRVNANWLKNDSYNVINNNEHPCFIIPFHT